MDINLIVNISSRAWVVDILAALHDGVPARQAPLLARTGASRTAFLQSLNHLVELNLLERNQGHGHPLRPEYKLTVQGVVAAKIAHHIARLNIASAERPLLRRNWTIPVLASAHEPQYFSDIRRKLGHITDRALSQSIVQLQEQHWISRDVDIDARPPRPLYRAVNIGAEISAAARM